MFSKAFIALAAAVATGSILAYAAPASATPVEPKAAALRCIPGYFCAWEHSNFSGVQLLGSRAPRGSKVDVADNRVSSGSNNTSNYWKGMNRRAGWPDQNVFTFAPYTEYANIGTANDKIDHFDVA